MKTKRAYKFRLQLTREQEQLCCQFAGCSRFVWNRSLALKKELWESEQKSISRFELDAFLPALKAEFPWLSEAPSQALQQVNKDLDQAYKNFFRQSGFPNFKRKGVHDSFRFPAGITLLSDLNHKTGVVKLPKLGEVRFVKSREIKGIVKNATLSRIAGNWYISFCCDNVEVEIPAPNNSAVGIDRGVVVFAQCSDGKSFGGVSPLKKSLKKLAKMQKQLSRKKKFSKNWIKQKHEIQKIHHHISNVRNGYLHKVSTEIAKNHGTIVLEDLKVKNMSRSAKGNTEEHGKNVRAKAGLNRSILDQGWGNFRLMLEYKSKWNGGSVVLIDPKNTSRRCSCCGHTSAENRKTQSAFVCISCGHSENADLNAAKNILAAGLAVIACGEGSLEPPVKQEPVERKTAPAA